MTNSQFIKVAINGLAFAGLLIAFIIGQRGIGNSDQLLNSHLIEKYQIDDIRMEREKTVAYCKQKPIGYLSQASAQGYGGPLQVLILSDSTGKIMEMDLLHHTETNAYVAKLRNKRYFEQYPGKGVNDSFLIRDDISIVSGATISCNAIALASREASWDLAANQFALELPEIHGKWNFSHQEVLVLILFILGAISVILKKKKLRYLSLFASFILIGFVLNASISLSHIGKVFLGYFPDIKQHFIWYILLIGNVLTIIILKRNVYCNSICPFHAAQILLNKISGINMKLAPQISRILIHTPKVLLWISLVLILISKNPTMASYEPFAMFFSLEGMGIQWYILPFALIGALFVSDFFCHYFCPVGASFNLLLKGRRKISNQLKKGNG